MTGLQLRSCSSGPLMHSWSSGFTTNQAGWEGAGERQWQSLSYPYSYIYIYMYVCTYFYRFMIHLYMYTPVLTSFATSFVGNPFPLRARPRYRDQNGIRSLMLDDDGCDCHSTLSMGHAMRLGREPYRRVDGPCTWKPWLKKPAVC